MTDPLAPTPPSMASLLKALAIATAIASVLLVLVVLPAERNIDITGFGKAIGLTVLSAPEAAPADAAAPAPAAAAPAAQSATDDHATVELLPGRGQEYKFRLSAGAKLKFAWQSDAGDVYYDFHGEPRGAAKDVFESFAAGDATGAEGTLTAPFDGTHGWYWKNSGTEPIRITLVTSGAYEILGLR